MILKVRSMKVEKRINEIVNRLNKTKTERFPDLRVEREQRDQEEREDKRKEMHEKVFCKEYLVAKLLKVLFIWLLMHFFPGKKNKTVTEIFK